MGRRAIVIGSDLEWTPQGIDVLGLAWDGGKSATATDRTPESLVQYLDVLNKADVIVGQNFIDADLIQMAKERIDTSKFRSKVFDIRLAMHAVNGHLAGSGSYDLRSIALLMGSQHGERFPLDWKQYEADLHKTCAYDSAAALYVYTPLARQIDQLKLQNVVAISHKCAPILAQMREQGVKLDKEVLKQIYDARKEKTAQIIEHYHLWEERGKKVIKRVPIWRSDKILDICEQQFGFRPKDRQRKTWAKLLTDKTLSKEAIQFVAAIMDLGRGANDAHWLGQAEESEDGLDFSKVGADGFIHPRYDLCGSPDRAIAASPNIQNFPRPSDDPRPIPLRKAVIPLQKGHVILGVDFSSVETITNAYESQDMDRVRAVLNKTISHEGTASLINNAFGLNLNRNQGKACNHAFDKGESPWNLACRLFNSERPSRQQVNQCGAIFQQMLKEYPKTAKFRDELWERSRENPLVVTNSFGRRLLCFSRAKYGDAEDRYAKHVPEKKYWCTCGACAPRRDRWKYAIAFLGRSCAFDALLRKMAMIYYGNHLDEYSLPYLEVHDELDYSVPLDKLDKYKAEALACFQSPIEELGGICLPADAKSGASWSEAH